MQAPKHRFRLAPGLVVAALLASAALVSTPAKADYDPHRDGGGSHGCWPPGHCKHWGGPRYYGYDRYYPPRTYYYYAPPPAYYYSPPPVYYYAPPPVYYYAPPPRYYYPQPSVDFDLYFHF